MVKTLLNWIRWFQYCKLYNFLKIIGLTVQVIKKLTRKHKRRRLHPKLFPHILLKLWISIFIFPNASVDEIAPCTRNSQITFAVKCRLLAWKCFMIFVGDFSYFLGPSYWNGKFMLLILTNFHEMINSIFVEKKTLGSQNGYEQ